MSALEGLALLVLFATPLSILVFLTAFLVNMGKGRWDTWFTRLCDRAMVPAGLFSILLILVGLRYF